MRLTLVGRCTITQRVPAPCHQRNDAPILTIPCQDISQTAKTAEQAAHALWHFAQTWFFEFPHYKPGDNRISPGAESYGSPYEPGFQRSLEDLGARYLHIRALGIVNGFRNCVLTPYLHKTYGIQIFGKVNDECIESVINAYSQQGHALYDISRPTNDPFPSPHMYGYLTEGPVLAALGVPVNYSEVSSAVAANSLTSHDMLLGGFLDSLAYVLDAGVKVHLVYGDRDYVCGSIGGERVSLAIPHARRSAFVEAGYAPLVTAVDGVAGHEVPSYQPVAAYESFRRATFDLDIATGLVPDVWHIKNVPSERPAARCYVLNPLTYLPEVWEMVEAGTAVVRDWFVVGGETGGEHGEPSDTTGELSEGL
ncbi:Alpha/Beta hydrolase protein [Phialemonium atrogriseum]|uniref:Alpha/Beta hydrolase protein n=1 Tax=Phialemonium atrogriseum TaxID=1093897 RepID=A0AAJ0BTJ2_9PEZI|nr:Alpha/Beta hydrolase protein [Phialemonium atrogriseum]KAK1764020.1 Alpha/Beta hydrolase protein [Phialemonium atrogriseum]